jgi:hypothetical protein
MIITKSNKSPYFPVRHKAEAQKHCAQSAHAGTLDSFKTAAFLKNNQRSYISKNIL